MTQCNMKVVIGLTYLPSETQSRDKTTLLTTFTAPDNVTNDSFNYFFVTVRLF